MTNGEKFKTAQERAEAFRKYCEKMHDISGGPCVKQERCSICSLKWIDLEADEEKPLPCPFCGGECETNAYNLGFVESCVRCGYRSEIKRSKAEAIAAHNRVAKAVQESEAAND